MRVSTTAEPEPELAIERQPPQPSGLERQPTQPPELIAQATPTPDASADQAVKIPVSSPEIKAYVYHRVQFGRPDRPRHQADSSAKHAAAQ